MHGFHVTCYLSSTNMGDNLAHGTLGHDMVIAYHGVAPSKAKTISLTNLN